MKTLTSWLQNDAKDCGLCDPPMKAQEAVDFLKDYLLGENWYVTMPQNAEQCNTAIVIEILCKYSPKFRKELKEAKKEKKRREKTKHI